MWMRGLKDQHHDGVLRRGIVASYVDAWIERRLVRIDRQGDPSRILCGCVD